MQVNNVGSVPETALYSSKPAVKPRSNTMGADEFMQLLMAQMTHQDPMEPMSNTEMMSQFSQLSSLQELRDIHTVLDGVTKSNQAEYLASLIGRVVKGVNANKETIEGIVDGVIIDPDHPQLLIGSDTVNLSEVIEIKGEVK